MAHCELSMFNLNKILPRLTIRAKLAIAFMLLALVPLGFVGALGTGSALAELRRSAEIGLDHDMELAQTQSERALGQLEQHVGFVTEIVGRPLLRGEGAPEAPGLLEAYLVTNPSPLFRLKVIDGEGIPVLVVDRRRAESPTIPEPLYRWAASGLRPGEMDILPIEVRSAADSTQVTPAVAILAPVWDGEELLGTVVGEAEAEPLFSGLEAASPLLQGGVTALADENGHFLFHSRYKRDWASLLAGGDAINLATDLPAEIVSRVRDEASGSWPLDDGRILSHRKISFGTTGARSLILYRTLPSSVVYSRLRQFLVGLAALSVVVAVAVLSVSAVAASQITRPVYALGDAARQLTSGSVPGPLQVETNDELEDLARDFNRMAEVISKHRTSLESLVERRTSQLLNTEAHLGRIVTDATDAIVALTPNGEIGLWNAGAEQLFGYTPEEVAGKSLGLLGKNAERAATPLQASASQNGRNPVVNVRTELRAKDGTSIPVTVTRSEIHDEEGSTIGHSLIIRDERAREQLEEQMRRSERLAAVSVMAGGIAHELNNPLSILGNRIELMQRDAVRRNAEVAMLEDLEVLRRHVGRIGSVTNDLIRFARDDEDELVGVDIDDVVLRVTRLLRKIFVGAGLALEVDAMDDLPTVLGSESAIETVLVNLLLNAQQATPPGGTVWVTTNVAEDQTIRVEIRDSGPGIPEDLRRRVFEPFFTTKAAVGGTGLGLAVCRAVVDRMGGKLELVSGGTGATFVVSLPPKVEIQ